MSIKNIFKTLVVFGGLSVLYPIAEAAEPAQAPVVTHHGCNVSKFALRKDYENVKLILANHTSSIGKLNSELLYFRDNYTKNTELAALSARLDDCAKKADLEAQKDAVNQLQQELTNLNTSFTLLQEILKKEKEDNAKLHTALQKEQEKNDKILGQFVGFLEQYKNEKEESAATIETLEKQIRELQDL